MTEPTDLTPRARVFGRIVGLVQVLVGLQWLITGLYRWLSPGFANQFTIDVAQEIHENRSEDWYHHFFDVYLVPNGALLGTIVVALEIAVGVILLLGAIDWLLSHRLVRHWLHGGLSLLVVTALLVGIFLDWNIALVHGSALPAFGGGTLFDKVISIDFFLILLSLILIAADLLDIRLGRAEARAFSDAYPGGAEPKEVREGVVPETKTMFGEITEDMLRPRPVPPNRDAPAMVPDAASTSLPTTDQPLPSASPSASEPAEGTLKDLAAPAAQTTEGRRTPAEDQAESSPERVATQSKPGDQPAAPSAELDRPST